MNTDNLKKKFDKNFFDEHGLNDDFLGITSEQ